VLARFPSEWDHSLDKKSRNLKKLARVHFTRTIPGERNALWSALGKSGNRFFMQRAPQTLKSVTFAAFWRFRPNAA
jgi:hypothetical protein